MTKPISKNDYNRFIHARNFTRHLSQSPNYDSSFSGGFIRSFGMKGLITREQIDRIKYIAKHHDEFSVREYVEEELVNG